MKELRNSKGFTLIELLVVVAIIGILAAIAIPQFAVYRQKGFDAQANSDVRNIATAQEAYFATNKTYLASCMDLTALPGATKAVETSLTTCTGNANDFTIVAKSNKGSGKVFSYLSASGGMQP